MTSTGSSSPEATHSTQRRRGGWTCSGVVFDSSQPPGRTCGGLPDRDRSRSPGRRAAGAVRAGRSAELSEGARSVRSARSCPARPTSGCTTASWSVTRCTSAAVTRPTAGGSTPGSRSSSADRSRPVASSLPVPLRDLPLAVPPLRATGAGRGGASSAPRGARGTCRAPTTVASTTAARPAMTSSALLSLSTPPRLVQVQPADRLVQQEDESDQAPNGDQHRVCEQSPVRPWISRTVQPRITRLLSRREDRVQHGSRSGSASPSEARGAAT